MLSQPPEHADPRRLCEQGKAYAGTVALRDCPRLAPLLTSSEGDAAFTLVFDRDADKRPRIHGQVTANLHLRCERCLGSMSLPVQSAFQLAPVEGPQEAERLPEDYDPLLMEGLLRPLDIVEDELILAIPPAPRHPEAECAVDIERYRVEPPSDEAEQPGRENPFAALGSLKHDNEK